MIRHAPVVFACFLLLACATPEFGVAQVSPDEVKAATAKALSRFGSGPDSSRIAKILTSGAVDPLVEARLWVHAGHPALALEALESLPPDRAGFPSAYLERARVGLRYGDAAEAQRAAGFFWQACSGMDAEVKRELWLDLLPLMTPIEREAWEVSEAGSDACQLVHDMFEERARLMATSEDDRLALHYGRLHEAEGQYWIKRPRFYREISDVFGRPPGLWLDDRGLLLIRLGEPDHEEACPLKRDLLALCWAYYRPVGYKLFFLSTMRRVDGGLADGDYKIQESLGPRAGPGNLYFHTYVVNGDLPKSLVNHIILSAAASLPHHSDLKEEWEKGLDLAEGRIYRRLGQVAVHRFTSEAIESIPDVPAIASSAVMRWEALRFYNPSQEQWQVWVLASVRADDLETETVNDSTVYEISAKLAARTSNRYALDSLEQRVSLPTGAANGAGIPVRMSLTAEPGPVPFTLAITDDANPGTGTWVQDTIRVPSSSRLAHLSDIAVAQREGGSWTRDGETFLQVTPSHITDPEGNIHVYFEVYGIRAGRSYEVEVRLGRTDEPDEIFSLDPSELPFRLEFGSSMPSSRIGRHHVRLELGETKPGSYTLGIRVRDPAIGYYTLPSVTPIHVANR